MGQKVNPNGLRYGINKNWNSRWVPKDDAQMTKWLIEDEQIRLYFDRVYKAAQIVNVEIERTQNSIDIYVHAGQPGAVLGKESANIKTITLAINKIVGRKVKINVNVINYENVSYSAKVIAREIADAIENRVPFRMAQKTAIRKVMGAGLKGIKTKVSGRLGGVEMAREEGYSEGIIPLTTLRADIDYAIEEANTTYGKIGCKVWINRGEIFGKGLNNQNKPVKQQERREFVNRKDRNFKKPFNNKNQLRNNVTPDTNKNKEEAK